MPVINIEDLTEKDKLKMEVDQLKKEAGKGFEGQPEDSVFRPRSGGDGHGQARPLCAGGPEEVEVSKCCEEVRDYIEERSGEDPLVKGVPEDKNPFKELKGGCVIS
ncbi:guanine nucleotide-binding protein G(T) subunit gamma-T1 isoform X1 [Gracilinanus agilis]|uniref:guanine nucleotide-binding protein G(T) subunit gamma-T1 isoform X1 n=1 Tax=Gracilinanus agilis TaxID=191870 RepID=UPI001CFE7BAE|nr:guanine nucleotide-binding protein G(T) subunit gamma-T1 isoform X1 [Gracilinanus agilis]